MTIMLKKIFKVIFFFVISIALIVPILFGGSIRSEALIKGWNPPGDDSLSAEANGDNPLGIVIEPSEDQEEQINEDSINGRKINNYPDLGSEQVFPFEPGLGNSAF